MATTTKVLSRAFASSPSNVTLYTVPASTTTVVTNIVVTNTSTSAVTFNLFLNAVKIFGDTALAANSTAMFDVKQVLAAGQIISGGASSASVNWHISGVEIN